MKPQVILQLEKDLNTKFSEVKIAEILKSKPKRTAEYSTDRLGNIIGLCISGFDQIENNELAENFKLLQKNSTKNDEVKEMVREEMQ